MGESVSSSGDEDLGTALQHITAEAAAKEEQVAAPQPPQQVRSS